MAASLDSLQGIIHAIHHRQISATEVIKQSLERIESGNASINAMISICGDEAVSEAEELDRLPLPERQQLPLLGVPLAVKDLFCTRGLRTTCGSRLLERFCPTFDATVVARLRRAGAVIVGKTNLDEFGMGSTGEFSAFGPIHNPWRLGYSAGGSSGGSAAAVAAGWVPVAIGTDTGGSVRQPAAWCGVSGMKPTYGAVSRFGMVAFASSLDQAGIFARSAREIEIVFNVMAGHDPLDMTSSAGSESLSTSFPRRRVGYIPSNWVGRIDPEVERCMWQAIAAFQSLGYEIVELSMPREKFAIAAYYVIASCEAASNLARYDGVRFTERFGRAGKEPQSLEEMYGATRGAGFGPEVQRRILLGTFCLSHGYSDQYYRRACQARQGIRRDYAAAFREVSAIIGPTSPTMAIPLGSRPDPIANYMGDIFTVSANLAGIPALSIPCGFSADGRPIGLQLLGPWWSERELLALAAEYQQTNDFHERRPA